MTIGTRDPGPGTRESASAWPADLLCSGSFGPRASAYVEDPPGRRSGSGGWLFLTETAVARRARLNDPGSRIPDPGPRL
jgi:hypothetical protein